MWRSCPAGLVFPPHFLKIVVEVKSSGPPHILKLWLVKSKGMHPVIYFCYYKPHFWVSQISLRSHGCHKMSSNLATLSFGDITGFKIVVPRCLWKHPMTPSMSSGLFFSFYPSAWDKKTPLLYMIQKPHNLSDHLCKIAD